MKVVTDIRHVAVIGSGIIGASWSALFLAQGLEVTATDANSASEVSLRKFIADAWPALKEAGLAPGASPSRLKFATSLQGACSGADFVQENVTERQDVKVRLFAEIEKHVRPNVVISSSSSALTVSVMQQACAHPERMVLGHPFNPPHLMPLVEVAGGEKSSPAAVEAAMAFYASLGKTPIRLQKEVYGHVANRLQAAVFREAVHLFQSGVASLSDIDKAMTEGPGLRWALMGPFLTYSLAGGEGGMAFFMKHFARMLETIWADLGNPTLDAQTQSRIVQAMGDVLGEQSPVMVAEERDRRIFNLLQERAGKPRIGGGRIG